MCAGLLLTSRNAQVLSCGLAQLTLFHPMPCCAGAQARNSLSGGQGSSPTDSAASETQQADCGTHWDEGWSRFQEHHLRLADARSRR